MLWLVVKGLNSDSNPRKNEKYSASILYQFECGYQLKGSYISKSKLNLFKGG